jgi:hypothetical protein
MSNVFAHTVCGLGGFFVFLLRITENEFSDFEKQTTFYRSRQSRY